MSFTKRQRDRLAYLRIITQPLSPGDIARARLLQQAKAERAEAKDDAVVVKWDARIAELSAMMHPFFEERLLTMRAPAKYRASLQTELDVLAYQEACATASIENKATLQSQKFLDACQAAGVQPTRRQASKYRIGRRGASTRAAGRIA